MNTKYQDYLKTDYWKAVTLAVKKRAGYRCQLCNSQHDLAAHHRTYEHRGRELHFLDDLTCLCRRCHGIFHGTIQIEPLPQVPTPEPVLTKKQRKAMRVMTADGMTNVIAHTASEIEAQMPDGAEIVLNREILDRCRANGAFTTATTRALGLGRKEMARGWVDRLDGVKIPRDQFREALRGKYFYAKKCFKVPSPFQIAPITP